MPISREEFERLPDPEQVKKEVAAAIMRIKDPESFLEGCRQYVYREKRDSVYLVAMEYAQRHENSPNSVGFAAQTLLLGWGTRFYSTRMREVQNVLDDLLRLYETNADKIEKLSTSTLGKITESDLNLARELFQSFAYCDSIKWTGASKALHIRIPRVFVMWDQDIRIGYHLLHSPHDPVTCYGAFLKTSNEVAGELVARISEVQLSLHHPSYGSTRYERTLAKMMDEYNFAIVKPIVAEARRKQRQRSQEEP